ncbi:MAG: manganese efflux pump [Clostridiales bacterium]|nr:manganese efflux pump [Clostridiales bacterium]
MSVALFFTIFISGLTLAVDAFAVSVTDGMVYRNLSKTKAVIIPLTFGIFQAVMPIIGFYISWGLSQIKIIEEVDHWIALVLLVFIGGKMIFDGSKELRSPDEKASPKKFSLTEVLIQGVATSIDALAVGFTFTVMFQSVNQIQLWAWISVLIIGVTTFLISLAGLMIGIRVGQLFRKKACVAEIVGGIILILIGIKIVVGAYVALPF